MKSLAAALTLALLAPSALGTDNLPLATSPLYHSATLKGEDVLALPAHPGTWLVASASRGLLLVDQSGQAHPLIDANLEALDARSGVVIDGARTTLISAIDRNSGALVLLGLAPDTRALKELARLDSASALPETQCLHRTPDDGHLALFTADAQGMVHQRIVYDGGSQTLVDIPVRSFVGVPDAQACTVDDQRGALYLVEETLGVWRYAVDPETDASRDAIALTTPHGALIGEVADIALDDGGKLWVLAPEQHQLQRYGDDGLIAGYRLSGVEEASALALARTDGKLALAILDEGSDSVRRAELDLPAPPAAAPAPAIARIHPSAETAAVARFGDAADDPVVWINPKNAGASLIIGTDKREGLKVYNLDGSLRQSLNIGRLNNVDLIASTQVKGRQQPLIAASNRNTNSISLFTIDRRAKVHHLGDIQTNLNEVYGLCMAQSASGDQVYINDSDGRYQQYRVRADAGVSGELVREFRLPSQPEGCAVDAVTGHLYMGEEKAGIWRAGAEADGAAPTLIIPVDDHLTADVEGMDIYSDGKRRYLVVSSQGNDSYLVYGLWEGLPRLGQFRIGTNLVAGVDGVSETDGLAVTAAPLPGYPKGVLVVQDGRNRMPEQPQNFKLVDWRQVEAVLDVKEGAER